MNQRQSPPTRRRSGAGRKRSTLGNLRMVRVVPGVVVWCAAVVALDVSSCSAQQPNRPAAVRIVPVDPFSLGAPSSARPALRRESAEVKMPVRARRAAVPAPVVAAPARPRTPAVTPEASSSMAEPSRSTSPSVPHRATSSLLSRRAEQLGRQLREQFLSGPRSGGSPELQDAVPAAEAPADSYRSSSYEAPSDSASEQAAGPAPDQNLSPIAAAPAEESARPESSQMLPPGELPNFETASPPAEVPAAEESLPTPSLSQFIVPARNVPRQTKVGTADDVMPAKDVTAAKAVQVANSATPAAVAPAEQTVVAPVIPSRPALGTASEGSSTQAVQAKPSANPASVSSADQIRQALQIILQQKFPEHRLRLENEGTALVVTGVARSRQEAVQIMAFLRNSYLAPVIDRLEVPRAGAAVSSRP